MVTEMFHQISSPYHRGSHRGLMRWNEIIFGIFNLEISKIYSLICQIMIFDLLDKVLRQCLKLFYKFYEEGIEVCQSIFSLIFFFCKIIFLLLNNYRIEKCVESYDNISSLQKGFFVLFLHQAVLVCQSNKWTCRFVMCEKTYY